MTNETYTNSTVITPSVPLEASWTAWINKMPPPPDELHVRGQVTVPNPGVDVLLHRKVPQGFVKEVLLLDLLFVQRPGVWPQVLVTKPAIYDEVGRSLSYTSVSILVEGTQVASIDVDIVS